MFRGFGRDSLTFHPHQLKVNQPAGSFGRCNLPRCVFSWVPNLDCAEFDPWEIPQTFWGVLKTPSWQFFVAFLGWLSDHFQWLSDLQLGDEKVTLNHLVPILQLFHDLTELYG